MYISHEQIQACFVLADAVYHNRRQLDSCILELRTQHGMNPNSARDYIYNFRKLMNGEVFHRTMNQYAAEHYMSEIYRKYGLCQLSLAIMALHKHIEYYENLDGTRLIKLRSILQKFIDIESTPIEIQRYVDTFQQQIEQSMQDPSDLRQKRLNSAHPKPRKAAATTEVFIRNPDVIAEVLSIAKGKCQRCGKDGPFKRRTDGSYYLEVHHIIWLVNNGEDTVANAQALCPNCHREIHHGILV